MLAKMMTLQELEETVDDQDEVLKRSSLTWNDSIKAQGGNLHSTQSITGRQSLLTLDHVQHVSASDALNAYINSFEESHPLQTSSYIYNRTPEDLLLPQCILSQTVDRSLKTGKNDTKEEFHLHNVKRIIDESYDEILRADLEKEQAEAVLLSSQLLTRVPSTEVSFLPDPDQATKMTPLLKSTPIHNYNSVQPSQPLRNAPLRKTDNESRKYKTFDKLGSFPRSSQKRQETRSPLKYPSKNEKEIPAVVVGDEENVAKHSWVNKMPLAVAPDAELSQMKRIQSPMLNDSLLSGGRPPPSWVNELDNSQIISVSKKKCDSAAKKGTSSSQKKFGFGFKKADLLNDGIEVGSVSSYGIDEVALLKEVDGIIEQRRHERRRKEAEAVWMKKRWHIDRRNESLFEKPTKIRIKPQRTESVTTDDLVTASPYGLDKRRSGSFDKVPSFESSKLRNGTQLHPHQSSDLTLRTRKRYLSKSEGTMQERTRWHRENKLSGSNLLKSAVRPHHSSHLLTPNMLRKVREPTEPFLSSHGVKPPATMNHCPSTAPSGHTDSLLLASPFGEVKSQSSASARKMESPHVFRKKFKTFDDLNSESHPSTLIDTGGGATVGTVGDTARVDAVINRAQRLMRDSPDNEHQLHYKRSALDSTYPGSIIDRYLGDCLQESQENSNQQRPLESLKQILFSLQDLEDTQTALNHQSNRLQSKEEQKSDERHQEAVIDLGGCSLDGCNNNSSDNSTDNYHEMRELEPGGESINKALAHLSRLKLLISEGDTTSSAMHAGVS